MSRNRYTMKDVETLVDELAAIGYELGIPGADYWSVENPYGPHGLHFLENHYDDGRWVTGNTALGSHYWSGPKEACTVLGAMLRALQAARKATAVPA